MPSKTTIFFFCFILLLSMSFESRLKKTSSKMKSKKTSSVEVYRINYYATCTSSDCPSGLYCLDGKCVKDLEGAKGSYCGWASWFKWIICGDGLNCVDNLCIDKSKESLIKYVKKY